MEDLQEHLDARLKASIAGLKQKPAANLVQLLEFSDSSDLWQTSLGLASSLSPSSVLIRHKELVNQEILAVLGRLTWAALIPQDWRSLSSGARIDCIRRIVRQTLDLSPKETVQLATRLNRKLANIEQRERRKVLSYAERQHFINACDSRCQLCGRQFSAVEKNAILRGKPQDATTAATRVDKWKPIFSVDRGWTIAVDHILPITGQGTDELSNFQLACHYCNSVKRNFTSFFDIAPKIAQTDTSWKLQGLRLLANSGCYCCGSTIRETELTIGLCAPESLPTIQNFYVTCYGHDPMSKVRWSPLGSA